MQPDPLSLGASDLGNPQSLNLYSYVQNDPINNIDPEGLFILNEDEYVEKMDPVFAWADRYYYRMWVLSQRGNTGGGGTPVSDPPGSGGQGKKAGDDDAIKNSVEICDLAGSVAEHSNVLGDEWKGRNGKWNSKSWGGNGATGARALALSKAAAWKKLGHVTFGIGTVASVLEFNEARKKGNNDKAGTAAISGVMGAVGNFGGPLGAVVGGYYSAIDLTIGWDKIYEGTGRANREWGFPICSAMH